MAAEDLIPLGQDPEHDAKVRAKLKGSSSPKRKLAQQTRRLKEKVESGADIGEVEERLLAIVRDPEVSALKIQEVIMDMLENEKLNHRTKVELIGKMVQAHTAIHGQKQKNINFNVDIKLEDIMEKWSKKMDKIEKVHITE